ncbi:DUF6897 domain-containing protein [Anaerophilus nitritogenes]|uniref:DUF6897 domain-containing protein n=1 Tax=Anaerophilus nitritogenes TaxID=2498136 RepID=UPI00101C82B7|nr:hypothetical protein [Anaerophilus nitritogenes]
MTIVQIIKTQFQGIDIEVFTEGGFTFTGSVADGSDTLVVLSSGGILTTIAGDQIVAFRPL